MRGIYCLSAVALASGELNCGPSPNEQGRVVLLVAPLVVLLAMAVQWLLLRLWKNLRSNLELSWRPNWLIIAPLALLALWPLVLRDFRYAVIAFWLFGTTYLALLLAITRVMLFFRE